MIKPIKTGFIFKMPSIKQIYNKDRMVNIMNNGKEITKTYIDTNSMKILKIIKELIK